VQECLAQQHEVSTASSDDGNLSDPDFLFESGDENDPEPSDGEELSALGFGGRPGAGGRRGGAGVGEVSVE